MLVNVNFYNDFNAILPVQISTKKHSASRRPQITTTTSAIPSRYKGRIAIVTEVGMGCGGRSSVGRARRILRVRERSGGAQTNDVAADGKAVWSWHPLLVSSRRRSCGPDRASRDRQFADDGDKKELLAEESAE
jgi:hypothetical protein